MLCNLLLYAITFGSKTMKRTNYLFVSLAILGTFSNWSVADDENRKTLAEAERRHFETSESDRHEQQMERARKERREQLTQHAAELEATAKQLASDGKQDLANVFLQQMRQIHERE